VRFTYNLRVAKRNDIARLIVADSVTNADMLYATRFFAGDPFIFLEQNGKRTIVLTDLEIDRGRKEAQVDEFVAFSGLEREVQGKSPTAPVYEKVVAHFLEKRGVKRARVPANFPLGYAKEMAASGIELSIPEGQFWPERESKSEAELGLMRRAMQITESGMKRGIEVLRAAKPAGGKKLMWNGKALTSEVLRAEIDNAVMRAGGIAAWTIVAGGIQACDPHERGSGLLRADSLIILDIFPRDAKTGYFGDMTRTIVRGRATEAQRRIWNVVLEGQKLALKKMKPGVDGLGIHNEIKALFTKRGFPTEVRDGRQVGFFHGTGHGLGLDIHEHPRLQKTVLKKGQTLTVEPGLYYPDVGGVRIEDVVALTDNGIRMLSRFPKVLEI